MLCWSAWFCLTNPSTHPSIVDLLSVVTPQQQQLEQTSLSSSIFEHLPREESWWLLNQSLKVLGCSFNIMEQQFHSESHCMTKLLGLSLRETPATPRRKHISATCIHHLLSGGRIKEEVEPRMVPRLRTLLLAQPSVLHSSRVTVTLQLLKWFSGTSQAQFHLTEQLQDTRTPSLGARTHSHLEGDLHRFPPENQASDWEELIFISAVSLSCQHSSDERLLEWWLQSLMITTSSPESRDEILLPPTWTPSSPQLFLLILTINITDRMETRSNPGGGWHPLGADQTNCLSDLN